MKSISNAASVGGSGGGGLLPHLIISSSVQPTVVKGTTSVTATETSEDIWECDVPSFGVWQLSYTVDGTFKQYDFNIEVCKVYHINTDSWLGVQMALDQHMETELLNIGDEYTVTINNEDIIFQIGAMNLYSPHEVIFVSKNPIMTKKHHSSTNTNVGGWNESEIRTYLNGTYINSFPDEVRNNMKQLAVKTSAGNQSTSIITANDYIWVPREYEVFGSISWGASTEAQYCSVYPIYNSTDERIKSYGNIQFWALSSPGIGNSTRWCGVGNTGQAIPTNSTDTPGIVPCFRFTADS